MVGTDLVFGLKTILFPSRAMNFGYGKIEEKFQWFDLLKMFVLNFNFFFAFMIGRYRRKIFCATQPEN